MSSKLLNCCVSPDQSVIVTTDSFMYRYFMSSLIKGNIIVYVFLRSLRNPSFLELQQSVLDFFRLENFLAYLAHTLHETFMHHKLVFVRTWILFNFKAYKNRHSCGALHRHSASCHYSNNSTVLICWQINTFWYLLAVLD